MKKLTENPLDDFLTAEQEADYYAENPEEDCITCNFGESPCICGEINSNISYESGEDEPDDWETDEF